MAFIESTGAPLGRLLAYPGFTRFLSARLLASVAVQMQTVAVGWQVYAITGNPLDLGLIGLSQFLPFVLLVLPAGHVADRHNRAVILSLCIALEFICALALLAFTLSGLEIAWPVFAVMVVFGTARAFSMPAGQAIMPNLVPPSLFARGRGEFEHLAGLDDCGAGNRPPRVPCRSRRRLRNGRGSPCRGLRADRRREDRKARTPGDAR